MTDRRPLRGVAPLRRRIRCGVVVAVAVGAGLAALAPTAAALDLTGPDGNLPAAPPTAWARDLPGGVQWAAPAVADLDGDGTDEILVAAQDGQLRLYRFDGSLVWQRAVVPPRSAGAVAVDAPPTVVDITGDGRPEILVGAGSYFVPNQHGGVVVFDTAGTVLWRASFNDIFNNWVPGRGPDGYAEVVMSSVVAGDVDGDGRPEVVVAAHDNRVHVLRADGTPLPGWISEQGHNHPGPGYWVDDTIFTSPLVADLDGDGRDEIVVGVAGTPGGTVDVDGGALVAVEYEAGRARTKWIRAHDDIVTTSPVMGDVTGDGVPEIVVPGGYDYARTQPWRADWKRLFVIDPVTGANRPGWPRTLNGSGGRSLALGDLTGDGVDDIVTVTATFSAEGGRVYAFRGDGTLLWDRQPNTCTVIGCEPADSLIGAPIIADVDGNGTQDVAIASGWATFLLRGHDGARMVAPIELGRSFQSSLAVATAADGRRRLVVPTFASATSGRVAAVVLPDRVVRDAWPQYRADATRSGLTSGGGRVVSIEATPSGAGYWMLRSDGSVAAHGDAGVFAGSVVLAPGERAASLSARPSGDGYWVFTDRGRVFAFGNAVSHGDLAALVLNGPVLDSVATPSGLGYYMVASDGGVFALGDAAFRGSMGGRPLNRPVASLVPDPDGAGYWLVALDGGVFAFDAAFRGSLPGVLAGRPLNKPVSGMVPYGDGYVLVGEDGGAFVFSNRPFSGSLGDQPPPVPVTDIAVVPGADGYWMVDAAGAVYPFGAAQRWPRVG